MMRLTSLRTTDDEVIVLNGHGWDSDHRDCFLLRRWALSLCGWRLGVVILDVLLDSLDAALLHLHLLLLLLLDNVLLMMLLMGSVVDGIVVLSVWLVCLVWVYNW